MMIERSYVRRLELASFIAPGGYGAGQPVWMSHGLRAAALLIEQFVRHVSRWFCPRVVEHPQLLPEVIYRRVFTTYSNVFTVDVGGRHVIRPDNLIQNVKAILESGSCEPVVAVGSVLRSEPGSTPPLFRDRYIWPAVQLDHLVHPRDTAATIDAYCQVLEDLLADLCLPCITIRSKGYGQYDYEAYYTVSCRADGRPTILSTLYVLPDRVRRALGCDRDVIDLGFTGKLIALVSMHHWDTRGLKLPSRIAPIQLAALPCNDTQRSALLGWARGLAGDGLRVHVEDIVPGAARRRRLERRWHRLGVPFIAGLAECDARPARLTVRHGVGRLALSRLPGPDEVKARLRDQDAELYGIARRRFERSVRRDDALRALCPECVAGRAGAVVGRVHPRRVERCACGRGEGEVVHMAAGRIY